MVGLLSISVISFVVAASLSRLFNWQATQKVCRELQDMKTHGDLVILMPVCSRPRYLKRVLTELSSAAAIERTLVIFSQDGADPEISHLISEWKAGPSVSVQHYRPFLGILCYFWDSLHAAGANIHFLLSLASRHTLAKGFIVLEDDIVPSRDFILYYDWIFRHVLTSRDVMSVTAFNLDSRSAPSKEYDPKDHVYELVEDLDEGEPKFTGWSWAVTREMWQRIRTKWSFRSWDLNLNRVMGEMGMSAMKPVLARAKNVGMQGINFSEPDDHPKWEGVVLNPALPDYDCKPVFIDPERTVRAFDEITNEDEISGKGEMAGKRIQNQREKNRKRRAVLWLLALFWIVIEWHLFYS